MNHVKANEALEFDMPNAAADELLIRMDIPSLSFPGGTEPNTFAKIIFSEPFNAILTTVPGTTSFNKI